MKPEVLTLNINSDVFDPMKTDFNSVLKNTLRNMYSKQSDVAEITLKLKITLEEDTAPDIDSGRVTGTREIVKPLLSHKLSSVMQIKEEKSGSFNGNYDLVYDEDAKEFVIRPIEDAQMTFGDEFDMPCDGEIIDADFEDCDEDCDNEQPQIEGRADLPMLSSGDDTEEQAQETNSEIKYSSKLFFDKPAMKAVMFLTHKWVGEDGCESTSEFTTMIIPYSTILEYSEKYGYDSLFDELECACNSLVTGIKDMDFDNVNEMFFSGTHNHITEDVCDEETAEFLVYSATVGTGGSPVERDDCDEDDEGEAFIESLPDDFFDDDNDIPERIGDFEEFAE